MMKKGWTSGLVAATVVAFLLVAVSPAEAQRDKKKKRSSKKAKATDIVVTAGGKVAGNVSTESWKEVMVLDSGRTRRIPAGEVTFIIYKDAPAAFKSAMERISANDYGSAMQGLSSAEEYAQKNKVGPWFNAYLLYFRGYCMARQKKYTPAITNLKKFLMQYAHRYHMTRRALSLVFDALKNSKDKDRAKQTAQQIGDIPLPEEIKPYSDLNRAKFLRGVGAPRDALKIAEDLRMAGEPKIVNQALMLSVACFRSLKDKGGLQKMCDEIIKTSDDRAALFVAKAALGDLAFKAKDLNKAIKMITEAIVLHHVETVKASHEEALWTLANAYEQLGRKAKEARARQRFLFMASGTCYELISAHRKGKFKAQAEEKMAKIDEELAKPGGGGKKD